MTDNVSISKKAQEIWEAALGELQLQVSKSNFRTWLQRTVGIAYQDNKFVVGAPNAFVAEYLDQRQRSLIERTLCGILRHDVTIFFQITGKPLASTLPVTGTPGLPTGLVSFNPKYTFGSFIVGDSNRLSYAAACRVAEKPGKAYNPLFIYGSSGLGKTHLLHAIGHAALAHQLAVLCVSAEQFTSEFVAAVRDKTTEEFCQKYRNVDILMVDDVQFICGKEKTEETFFHTFNALHNSNRQIVLTADRAPKALAGMTAQLSSRLEWGLAADILPPEYETRLSILEAKAKEQSVKLSMDVLDLIASRNQQNIRELEGSLNRVVAYAALLNSPINRELAMKALGDIASNASKYVTSGAIMEAVATVFQLSIADLKGRGRDRSTALARQLAMYLVKQETDSSLVQIGREFGNRSPSTVMHAYDKVNASLDSPYMRKKILDIHRRLYPESGKGSLPHVPSVK